LVRNKNGIRSEPPFRAATAIDTVLRILSEKPVSPRVIQPKVPLELEFICLKCLEKDPSRRYSNAQALADDLRRFLAGESISGRPLGMWDRILRWATRLLRNPRS
jgi:hypothetical protein